MGIVEDGVSFRLFMAWSTMGMANNGMVSGVCVSLFGTSAAGVLSSSSFWAFGVCA